MSALDSVKVQWWIRRIPDWGGQVVGWAGGLLALYNSIPAVYRPVIDQAVAGNWQGITLGGAIGIITWAYSQIISYRKTVQSQVVQKVDGKPVSVPLKEVGPLPVDQVVARAPRKTLMDILAGK